MGMLRSLPPTDRYSAAEPASLSRPIPWPSSVLLRTAFPAGTLPSADLRRNRTHSDWLVPVACAVDRGSSCLSGSAFHLHPNHACHEVRTGSTTSSCPCPRQRQG